MKNFKNKLTDIENRLNMNAVKQVVFSVRYRKSEKELKEARETLKRKYLVNDNDPNLSMIFITSYDPRSEDSLLSA